MPKAVWGAGDKPLTAADIDGAERQEVRKKYSGELPTAGTYRWVIQSIQQKVSSTNNPAINVMMTLDGEWMRTHKQYDGCPVWDWIPVMDSTKERVANFLDSIGATGKDLMEGSVVDENGYITKLGRVGDPKGLLVYCNVRRKKMTKEYPNPGLETDYAPYLMVNDGDVSPDGESTEDDGGDPPF